MSVFCCSATGKFTFQLFNYPLQIAKLWIDAFNHGSRFLEAPGFKPNHDSSFLFIQFTTSTKGVRQAASLAYNHHLGILTIHILTIKTCLYPEDRSILFTISSAMYLKH